VQTEKLVALRCVAARLYLADHDVGQLRQGVLTTPRPRSRGSDGALELVGGDTVAVSRTVSHTKGDLSKALPAITEWPE